MSKSHRQIHHKKSLSSTLYLYTHNRSHSKKFAQQIPPETSIKKGRSLYNQNQLQEALKCFQSAIKNASKQHNLAEPWYLSAQILISRKKHVEALKHLQQLNKSYGNYKDNTLLLMAICYTSLDQLELALESLGVLCSSVPSVDAFFYRGKINFKQKYYKQALQDFKKTIELGNKSLKSKVFYYQTLHKLGKIEQCLTSIERLLNTLDKSDQNPQTHKAVKKLYAIKISILLEQSQLDSAEQCCNQSLGFGLDSETLFYKGKIHEFRNQKDQMVLAFNQSLTVGTSSHYMTRALQELIILAMKDKDFYEAFQYTKRISFLKIEHSKLGELSKLAEGVTFLMKKKYGEALLLFGSIKPNELISSDSQICSRQSDILSKKTENVKNLYYSSMGYAYFCLGETDNALKKYREIEKSTENDEHKIYYYNIALCQGIQLFHHGKIQQSIKKLETAAEFLVRPEPYFYIAVVLVNKHLADHTDTDFFMKIIEIIDTGLRFGQNSQMFYYRSALYLYLGMNSEAIDDIDKAIQKSEDNVARYFYERGLIFFQQRNYEQAITQLSTCISIDENFYDAYLERAKAKLLTEQIEEAFDDLKIHPMCDEWKPLFQLYLGHYDAIITEKNADERIMQNCEFVLNNFEKAGAAGKIILAIMTKNFQDVSSILQDAIEIGFPVGCLEIDDLLILQAYCCFKLNKNQEALQKLTKAQSALKQSNTISFSQQQQKKLLSIKFNTILLTLASDEHEEALQLCSNLINDVYEGQISDQLNKVQKIINNIIENPTQTSGESEEIKLFINDQMISHSFCDEDFKGVKSKFLVCFPKIKVMDIELSAYQQPLISFTMKDIENKPQAPWMRRDQNGVIFTTCIHNFDNLILQTEQNDKDSEVDKQKLKQTLQLDPQVLKKLEKLNKSNEQ